MSIFRTIPYAVLSGSLLVGGGAYAQSMSTIDQRQDYQQDRIEHGIRDGQITGGEARRLEQGERAIDRAQARARADGVVTQQERARIDRMTDRESREIYQQSHDRQQSWDRGQSWGHADGRNDGWRDNGGRQNASGHDGWGRDGDRGDRGNRYGDRGEHNGWDNNRQGIEHRDARQDQRIQNGVRDGSLTNREANRLENGQNRIDRYEARARSDGTVTPGERNRIDGMQNRESRQIYADRHNDRTATGTPPTSGTQAGNGSHNWGNGGWQHGPQAGNTTPTTPTTGTQPTGGSRNGGWQHGPQAGGTTPTAPTTGTQPAAGGSRSWGGNGGYRMQQAAATPQQQAQAPRPTMTRVSSPSPSTGGRSVGGRH
jgi:hypothetical protein